MFKDGIGYDNLVIVIQGIFAHVVDRKRNTVFLGVDYCNNSELSETEPFEDIHRDTCWIRYESYNFCDNAKICEALEIPVHRIYPCLNPKQGFRGL